MKISLSLLLLGTIVIVTENGIICHVKNIPRCLAVIVFSPTVSTAPAPRTSIHVRPLKNWRGNERYRERLVDMEEGEMKYLEDFDELAHDFTDKIGQVICTLTVLHNYLHQQWNNPATNNQ